MTTPALLTGFEPASIVVIATGAVIGLAALGAIVVLAMSAIHRRGSSETSSVDQYRRTLSKLEDIRSRPTPSVRVLTRDDDAGRTDRGQRSAAGAPPGSPPRQTDQPSAEARGAAGPYIAGRRRPVGAVRGSPGANAGRVVFGDDGESTSGLSHDRSGGRGRAMSAMNRRPRRLGAPLAVVVAVVVVLAVVVFLGDRSHNPPAGHHSTATTVTTSGTSQTSSPAHHHKGGGATTTTSTSTTTTTRPPDYLPTQASATTATYVPSALHYTLAVSVTSGPCWVCVTNGAGNTEFAETVPAGTSHTLALTGTQDVTLGAPGNAAVTIDGEPVVLPEGDQAPFEMMLLPAGGSGASTTSGC